MYVFASTAMMVKLLQKSDVINNVHLLWILLKTVLVFKKTTQLLDNTKLFMVKDHIISIFHYLPFTITPNIMVRKLTTITTNSLNWFPVKGRVSYHYFLFVSMHESPLNYEKHSQISFGTYVQVYDKS